MDQPMKTYTYTGPVYLFDRIASELWHGETTAPSLRKAKSNLAYQYKKAYGLENHVPVKIAGQVMEVIDNGRNP